ncbi:MAG: SAM-dependent methyltransferase, partial [Prevotella sp.]|nr:SAM-dependent methyltransferase [Prevotella sp.]
MNQATIDFIREHAEADVRQLALQGTKKTEVNLTYALEQIAGRQKAKTKLPSWADIDGHIYPPHLSMEQCSSEQTSRYKASIAGKGALVVDLTAGFGVDMAFISQGFGRAVHVERQPQLCAISSENYKLLGLHHIEVICGDGVSYLHTMPHANLIFIDPARRDEHGGRTYGIADCTPNVMEILDEMLEKADCVMLKLSPMLDWRKAVEDIQQIGSAYVSEVHIVSVDNECKELLVKVKRWKSENVKNYKVVCV